MTSQTHAVQVTLSEAYAHAPTTNDQQSSSTDSLTPGEPTSPSATDLDSEAEPPNHARTSTVRRINDSSKALLHFASADFNRLGIDIPEDGELTYWTADGKLILHPST